MIDSFKAMATRAGNAENRFIEYCVENGFNRDEALKIMKIYKKEKILKIDLHIGQFSVKHGIFLEKDVMGKALSLSS